MINKITNKDFWKWLFKNEYYFPRHEYSQFTTGEKMFNEYDPHLLMGYMHEYCFKFGIEFNGATNYIEYYNNIVDAINNYEGNKMEKLNIPNEISFLLDSDTRIKISTTEEVDDNTIVLSTIDLENKEEIRTYLNLSEAKFLANSILEFIKINKEHGIFK